jgi:hypothetical protein
MKPTSAHAIAFLALLVAIGGGIAAAHNGDTDKIHFCIANPGGNVRAVAPDASCQNGETPQDVRTQDVAYERGNKGPSTYPAAKGFRLVSSQMVIPASGDMYVITGKLVLSKPRNGRRGVVTCQLDGTDEGDRNDVSKATLGPGDSTVLSFLNRGTTNGRPGETVTTEMSCSSPLSRFTVSNVEIAALPMDTVSKGIDVPAATP